MTDAGRSPVAVGVAVALVALITPGPGCILPDKTIGEEPAACPEAGGSTAFLGGGACEACVASRCCDAAARCDDEAACQAHVACVSDCSATTETVIPPCFDECRTRPKTARTDELLACVDASCREACSLGTSFDCAGAYRWPIAETDEVTVQLRIVQPVTVPAIPHATPNRVMPCRSSETWPCPFDPARAQTTVDGLVALRLPTIDPLFPGRDNWAGYFHIEESDDLRRTRLFQNRGEYRDREIEDLPIPSDAQLSAYDGFGAGQGAGGEGGGSGGGEGDGGGEGGGGGAGAGGEGPSGFVVGQILDCRAFLNHGGTGMVVSIVPSDPSLTPPRVFYIRDVVPDARLTSTPPAGRFLAKDVPPGLTTFRVHRETDGALIAEEQMEVEAGALTVMGIYPGATR